MLPGEGRNGGGGDGVETTGTFEIAASWLDIWDRIRAVAPPGSRRREL